MAVAARRVSRVRNMGGGGSAGGGGGERSKPVADSGPRPTAWPSLSDGEGVCGVGNETAALSAASAVTAREGRAMSFLKRKHPTHAQRSLASLAHMPLIIIRASPVFRHLRQPEKGTHQACPKSKLTCPACPGGSRRPNRIHLLLHFLPELLNLRTTLPIIWSWRRKQRTS